MSEQLELLPLYLGAHLRLSLSALALGFGLSFPLGVWITRRRRLRSGVLAAASVIQTIPSLALLAIMVPLLAGLAAPAGRLGIEFSSIGFLPALIALTLYSVLPILRNTVTGISEVDPAVLEAGRAVGMTSGQRLWRVEIPLALPVIVAGLRTATIWVVGTATLSTPVGATSLGNFIFSGLQTRNFDAVLMGCISAAGLALLLDALVRLLESGFARRSQSRVASALVILLLLLTGSLLEGFSFSGPRDEVRIGSKTFTEQYILSELIALQVEAETQRRSRRVQSLGSTVAFDALRLGELDLYVDYSGTIWATVMKRQGTRPREELLREVGSFLRKEHGITLVAALGFENTYAIGMRREHAHELAIRSIADLRAVAPTLTIAGDYEFFARKEWKDLVREYGLAFRSALSMDSSLMYQALRTSDVDVISAFSTDGRIAEFGIVLLEDELGVIPPYDAILLASRDLTNRHPDVIEALRKLDGSIDAAAMRRLNLQVDREGRSPRSVARAFFEQLRGSKSGQTPILP